MAESDIQNEELSLDSAGARLRRAREAAGLSLGDIAARTKIAERHLASIEQSRFADLASSTYAVGFARAYARTVGLDEAEIALGVRNELVASDTARAGPSVDVFEPGDPARVPGSRLAWAAALVAVIVVGFVFINWRSFFSPAVSLPELTAPEARVTPSAASSPVVSAGRNAPVVFTALAPNVWVKFYDASGSQLMQKQMTQGESYTVPADADGPLLRTARPDALQISVGGRIVPRLSDSAVNLKDVPVSAAALLARTAPPAAAATAVPQASVRPQPAPTAAASPRPTVAVLPSPRPSNGSGRNPASPSPAPTSKPSRAATSQPLPAATSQPSPAATSKPSPAPTSSPAPADPPAAAAAGAQTSTVSN